MFKGGSSTFLPQKTDKKAGKRKLSNNNQGAIDRSPLPLTSHKCICIKKTGSQYSRCCITLTQQQWKEKHRATRKNYIIWIIIIPQLSSEYEIAGDAINVISLLLAGKQTSMVQKAITLIAAKPKTKKERRRRERWDGLWDGEREGHAMTDVLRCREKWEMDWKEGRTFEDLQVNHLFW